MPRSTPFFALATLAPAPLLVAGALGHAGWLLAAICVISAMTLVLDALVPPDDTTGAEGPAARALPVVLATLHFPLLALGIWAVAGPHEAGIAARAAAFLAFGLWFGQVSNSNAHELIHRPDRGRRLLGTWVFISLLFGHHATAHPAVHHRHVATPDDPNTARRGESFYRFLPRAWAGSFRAGWRVEAARQQQRGRPAWHPSNPYLAYLGGGLAFLALAWAALGPAGALAYAGLAFYAQAQLLLSDYVQHYGLRRARDAEGRYEPVSPRHSWDSPHWMSGLMMLNAPRHSDHHGHPARAYPDLRRGAPGEALELPYGLPLMGAIALAPRRWRRLMHPRLNALTSAGDTAGALDNPPARSRP